jgi:glycosyltransferase involved in cell wall biosynthesis
VAYRVLYLIDSLGMGGAERGLALTVRHLDRSQVEPEVAALWGPYDNAGAILDAGIPVHRLGIRPGAWAVLAVLRVRRLLKRGRFDAVHTQVVWASITGRIAGRLAGVKVLSHIANVDAMGLDRPERSARVARKAGLIARLDDWTGRHLVDRFVAISEAVRDHPVRGPSWDRTKISVVLRGQELGRLRERATEPISPPLPQAPSGPQILIVARLSEQKGHRYLLEALPDVFDAFPDARLLICGDGHLREELRERAARFGPQVEFLGIRADVPALLAACDLFVFPSLWEGQGNALLEAMAIGAPIVATAIPSTLGTLDDGVDAVLVPPADPSALSKAMVAMLSDPEMRARLSAAAALRASAFDIDAATRDLQAVYRGVLGGSPGGR